MVIVLPTSADSIACSAFRIRFSDDLLDLFAVDQHRRRRRLQLGRQRDVPLLEVVAPELDDGADDVVEVGGRAIGRAAAYERQQVPDDLPGARRLRGGRFRDRAVSPGRAGPRAAVRPNR